MCDKWTNQESVTFMELNFENINTLTKQKVQSIITNMWDKFPLFAPLNNLGVLYQNQKL